MNKYCSEAQQLLQKHFIFTDMKKKKNLQKQNYGRIDKSSKKKCLKICKQKSNTYDMIVNNSF